MRTEEEIKKRIREEDEDFEAEGPTQARYADGARKALRWVLKEPGYDY